MADRCMMKEEESDGSRSKLKITFNPSLSKAVIDGIPSHTGKHTYIRHWFAVYVSIFLCMRVLTCGDLRVRPCIVQRSRT